LVLNEELTRECFHLVVNDLAVGRKLQRILFMLSVNVDAAFDYATRSGATGVVIRDSYGKFRAASNRKVAYAIDPTSTEALAL
jgi:D-aminopeptidase